MTKSLLIAIISLTLVQLVQAQIPHQPKNVQYRMSLKQFKAKYKTPLTAKDTLNFVYVNNDTMVIVKDYVRKPGASVPYQYKDSTFLDVYKTIAFNHYKDSVSKKTTMKYWKEDIAIFFSNSVDKKVKKEFMAFAEKTLKNVDSLSIKEVKHVEDSNYIVYYNDGFEYESRISNYKKSDYYMHWNNKNQIYRLSLRLIKEDFFTPKLRLRELKKYFIKSLGHFEFNQSIDNKHFFSGSHDNDYQLSDFDTEIIKYHYSYGICKGTNLETFEDNHKKAKELLKNRQILLSFFHEFE